MKENNYNITENIEKLLRKAEKEFHLKCNVVPAGILVDNGAEFWVLKIKNGSVRRLYHQNHVKKFTKLDLPCRMEELQRETVLEHFHPQKCDDTDPWSILHYIKNHGVCRRKIDQQKKEILALYVS